MSDLGTVLVLAGGLSFEREVSLRSGRQVADALRGIGVDTILVDADASLLPAIDTQQPSVVLPLLHGSSGEDGAIRDVLEAVGVPYVGSVPAACRLAFDKPVAKAVVSGAGIAAPEAVALPHMTFRELGATAVLNRIVDRLGLPLMVKPTRGGSALGASIVRTADALPAAMVHCFSFGDTALVERFVDGVELAVSVIDTGDGPIALPPVRIRPADGVFDYTARYTAGRTEYQVPADLPDDDLRAATGLAVAAHQTLGLRDLSRVDLILEPDGRPVFLEVNVAPGMTQTSLFPMAVDAAGLDLGVLCRDLLEQAAGRT